MKPKISFLSLILLLSLFPNYSIGSSATQTTDNDWTNSNSYIATQNIETSAGDLTLQLKSDWFDSHWGYRQKLNIDHSQNTKAAQEYQILIQGFNTETLITQNKLNSDCSDLRFATDRKESLPYFIIPGSCNSVSTQVWVRVDQIEASSNTTLYTYYGNNTATAISSQQDTFSYTSPKTVGLVIDSNSLSSDLSVISLEDGNTITDSTSTLNLDSQSLGNFPSAQLSVGTEIKATKLFFADTSSETVDMLVPISQAGTTFVHYSNRYSHDYQIYSHFGNATATVYIDGLASHFINIPKGTSDTINTGSYNDKNVRIESDIPVHVIHSASSYDAVVLYPATSEDLYGIPSSYINIAAGENGANVSWIKYDGSSTGSPQNLSADSIYETTSSGSQGLAGAFKVSTDRIIGVTQLADGDGGESTAFWPLKELGTKFGANGIAQYIAVAAPYANTTCTVYDSTGNVITNPQTGYNNPHTAGSRDDINFLYFGQSSSSQHTWLASGWKMECDQPVYAYYENENGASSNQSDEHNLWSYPQMRQFTYPEPSLNSFTNEEQKLESSGTLTSLIIDTFEAGSLWGNLNYITSDDLNTSVKIRTGNEINLSGATEFNSCSKISNGSSINDSDCTQNEDRYIQYQIILTGDSSTTPSFSKITLDYDHTPISVQANITAHSQLVAGRTLVLDGSTSTGFDLVYNWALISGNAELSGQTSSKSELTVSADSPKQNIVVYLTVTDDEGNRSSTEMTIKIIPNFITEIVSSQITGVAGDFAFNETYVFDENGNESIQLNVGNAIIEIDNANSDYTLALTPKDQLVIGVPNDNEGTGSVYIFDKSVDNLEGLINLQEASLQLSQTVDIANLSFTVIKQETPITSNDSLTSISGHQAGDLFGSYITTGDLTGNGTDEIIVSAPGADDYGRVYIYNREARLIGVLIGTKQYPLDSISSENLLNTDGDDLIFGPANKSLNLKLSNVDTDQTLTHNELFSIGYGFEFTGVTILSNNFVNTTIAPNSNVLSFTTGDLNNDQNIDLIASDQDGNILVYLGPIETNKDLNSNDADITLSQGSTSELFGHAIAIGEVNGDNHPDLILGSPNAGANSNGALTIILGVSSWPASIDLDSYSQSFSVFGNDNQDHIGADILLRNSDDNEAQEIYTYDASGNFIILDMIFGSNSTDAITSGEGTLTNEASNGASSGCSLIMTDSETATKGSLLGFFGGLLLLMLGLRIRTAKKALPIT